MSKAQEIWNNRNRDGTRHEQDEAYSDAFEKMFLHAKNLETENNSEVTARNAIEKAFLKFGRHLDYCRPCTCGFIEATKWLSPTK